MKQREIFQLFDLVFKHLMTLSDRAVINCINGLFNTNHPPDSKVSRPSTETVDDNLRRSVADMVIVINDIHRYLIESQINNDKDMLIRIFRYILSEGQRSAKRGGHILTIHIPDARVIYWETTRNTPDRELLRFEFPDGLVAELNVPSIKFPEFSTAELEERRLILLLPFYLLKLRRQTENAKTGEQRRKLFASLKKLLLDIHKMIERGRDRELIGGTDFIKIWEITKLLYESLYSDYNETKEKRAMYRTIADLHLTDWDTLLKVQSEALAEKRTKELVEERTKELVEERTRELTKELTKKLTEKRAKELVEKRTKELVEKRTKGLIEKRAKELVEKRAEKLARQERKKARLKMIESARKLKALGVSNETIAAGFDLDLQKIENL
ncbi:MAG: hypothetical protein LBS57_04485 [Treponema sp.]|jgi:hypothetical protein|nr:hypothetical protein [Treponema sp.]